MAVGVKILLAGLLATHVAGRVLANSDLAKYYPREMRHRFLKTSVQESQPCPDLLLENGIVDYSESQSVPGCRPPRTVASLKCNDGYAMLYSKERMCLDTGKWTGKEASSSCVVISCKQKFNKGCCTANGHNCFVGSDSLNNICSCSANCYNNPHITCCPDIGCPRRTCSEAGLTRNGFCSWDEQSDGCFLPDEHCYCDEACCENSDCCPDVKCPPNATSRVLTGDSAIKELDGELRSMSRAQELSNEQQRAEWEAILRELLEIQKEK